jgi:hypothetical protein
LSVSFSAVPTSLFGPASPIFTAAKATPANTITVSPITATKMAILLVIPIPPSVRGLY